MIYCSRGKPKYRMLGTFVFTYGKSLAVASEFIRMHFLSDFRVFCLKGIRSLLLITSSL